MSRRRFPGLTGAVVGLLLATTVTACGNDDDVLHVYAAASLQATFEQLASDFEEEHGVDVELNVAGSSALVTQIQNGASADVFASADEDNMEKLVDDGLAAGAPQVFATNTLTIAVPPGNPADVDSLADLADDSVTLVVCAPQVPCGAASERVREAAGLDWSARSEEQNVTDVLNKVIAGEADAGLVYVTDAIGAGDRVETVDLAQTSVSVNKYPIVVVEGSDKGDLAQEFVDLVVSERARSLLANAGFTVP